ncbi:unnamed protein product [Paramecium octaurelia]|uniref:Uncharacterized protein n=1 Tax=Paramecium octaurelia TaxID=43137 RepID=A0A8S1TS14_PAROT|nr:unnamed protein product [Paramecium octaurelia]
MLCLFDQVRERKNILISTFFQHQHQQRIVEKFQLIVLLYIRKIKALYKEEEKNNNINFQQLIVHQREENGEIFYFDLKQREIDRVTQMRIKLRR